MHLNMRNKKVNMYIVAQLEQLVDLQPEVLNELWKTISQSLNSIYYVCMYVMPLYLS